MAHHWDRGVLNASSWHGLEEVGKFTDAASIIDHGERSGAWPTLLRSEQLFTSAGLLAPRTAIVADYRDHASRVLGCNGDRYRATTTQEWRDLVTAACAAGGKPTGAFSLNGGSRMLATFEIGESNGLRTQLLLVDAFDGSLKLTVGFTSIRVVCANTLAISLQNDGAGMAALRHTASLETKVKVLQESVATSVATGQKVKDMFNRASAMSLSRAHAQKAFDLLFPEGETPGTKTRAENARNDAMRAASLPVNKVGTTPGNVATLWNAATYLVDRTIEGTPRAARADADPLNSLLFGARAERLEEIQSIIEVVMRDGTIQPMTVPEARSHGIDDKTIGRKLLEDMLG